MAIWSEIKNSTEFYNETPEDKKLIADDYFNKVIAPQAKANGDDVSEVYKDFSEKALSYSSDEVASLVQRQLDAAQDVVKGVREDNKGVVDGARDVIGATNDIFLDTVGSVGRVAGKALTSIANTPAEVYDAVKSAGAWAGDLVGIGDGTYIPSTRFGEETIAEAINPFLPTGSQLTGEEVKPRGLVEDIAAETIPFLIGTGTPSIGRNTARAAGDIRDAISRRSAAESERDAATAGLRITDEDVALAAQHKYDLNNSPEFRNWLLNQEAGGSQRAEKAINDITKGETSLSYATRPTMGSTAPDTRLARVGDSLGRNLSASAFGSLAANSDAESDAGDFATDLLINTLGGSALEGVVSGLTRDTSGLQRLAEDVNYTNAFRKAISESDNHADIRELKDGLKSYLDERNLFNGTNAQGVPLSKLDFIGEKANLLGAINERGGKVGVQTLREQLNRDNALLDYYGITNTVGEKVGNLANNVFGDSNILENFGLREAGIDTARKKAAESTSKVISSDIKGLIDTSQPDGTNLLYSSLKEIQEAMSNGNYKVAEKLSKEFRDSAKSMGEHGISQKDIDEAFSINRDLQTLRKFMEKANKSDSAEEIRSLKNIAGRLLTIGGAGALAGIPGAIAAVGAKYGLSKANTANVARNFKDVTDAFGGNFQSKAAPSVSRASDLLRGATEGVSENGKQDRYSEALRSIRNYNHEEAEPQIINSVTAPKVDVKPTTTKFSDDVNRLYVALAEAETGGLEDRFIRTKAAESGVSTAYGPAQITVTLMKDFNSKHRDKLSPAEQRYVDSFIRQGERMKKAKDNDPVYGYGGTGALSGPNARKAYARVARKMLQQSIKDNNGDLSKVVRRWRGNDSDTKYFEKVRNAWLEN